MPVLERPFLAYFAIRGGENGWSEAWHLPFWIIGDAYDAVKKLALARSWLLPAGWQVEWASVRALAPPRLEWPAIGDPLPALTRWGTCNTAGTGLLMRFETGEGDYGQHLFRPIADSEVIDEKWIRAPLIVAEGPHDLSGDPNTVPAEELFRHVFALFRDLTCRGVEGLPEDDGSTIWYLEPWAEVQFNKVSSRQVGSAYKRVSWEALDWEQSPGYSPCGTVTTVLRSCYSVECRFFTGGPVQRILYYFAAPEANVIEYPTIFWGWRRDKEITNYTDPGETTGRSTYLYSLGYSWGSAPGLAATGTIDQFLGLTESPWGNDPVTPAAYRVVCDMPTPVPIKVDDLPNSVTVEDVIWITFDAATIAVEQLADRRAFVSALIPGVHPDVPPLPPAYVRILSLTPDQGRYSGELYHYDVDAHDYVVEEDLIWVVGQDLQLDRTYRADYVGHANERDVFKVIDSQVEAAADEIGNLPITLWQKAACIIQGSGQQPVIDAEQIHGHYYEQLEPQNLDEFEQAFTSPAFTGWIYVDCVTGPDNGILELKIDGTTVLVFDGYSSVPAKTQFRFAPISMTAGRHVLRGRINGTTGGGYKYQLTSVWFSLCLLDVADYYDVDEPTTVNCGPCTEAPLCMKITFTGVQNYDSPWSTNPQFPATFSVVVRYNPTLSIGSGTTACVWNGSVTFAGNTTEFLLIYGEHVVGYAYDPAVDRVVPTLWTGFVLQPREGERAIYKLASADWNCNGNNVMPLTDDSADDGANFPATCTVEPIDCDDDPVIDQECHDCEAVPVHWVFTLGATAADPGYQYLFDRVILLTYDANCEWESITEQPLATMRLGDYFITAHLLTPAAPNKWRLEVRASVPSYEFQETLAVYDVDAAGFSCLTCKNLNRILPEDDGPDSLGLASNWPATIEICPGDGSTGDDPPDDPTDPPLNCDAFDEDFNDGELNVVLTGTGMVVADGGLTITRVFGQSCSIAPEAMAISPLDDYRVVIEIVMNQWISSTFSFQHKIAGGSATAFFDVLPNRQLVISATGGAIYYGPFLPEILEGPQQIVIERVAGLFTFSLGGVEMSQSLPSQAALTDWQAAFTAAPADGDISVFIDRICIAQL